MLYSSFVMLTQGEDNESPVFVKFRTRIVLCTLHYDHDDRVNTVTWLSRRHFSSKRVN